MKVIIFIWIFVVVIPIFAQQQLSPAQDESIGVQGVDQTRYEIQVMERVLEQAVQHAVEIFLERIPSFNPPWLFTGPARARGFDLEDYGILFHVEVPAIRRNMAWSFRLFDRPDSAVENALDALQQHAQTLEGQSRDDLQQAIHRLELQIVPRQLTQSGLQGIGVDGQDQIIDNAMDVPPSIVATDNPIEIYNNEIKRAIFDAILNHSGSIGLKPAEWLTVAIRDHEDRVARDGFYEAVTITLRMQGSSLTAFLNGELTREEIRKWLEVQEF